MIKSPSAQVHLDAGAIQYLHILPGHDTSNRGQWNRHFRSQFQQPMAAFGGRRKTQFIVIASAQLQ
jgi:hypothetical protein